MAVKLDEAVKTQLKRRADDLKKELKDNKIDGDVALTIPATWWSSSRRAPIARRSSTRAEVVLRI